ncbi:MAG: 2OG-Fe(II) oxygenase [Archangium sp.]|nr:2OG-Fe(II) oxygenase [Archangium sp.]
MPRFLPRPDEPLSWRNPLVVTLESVLSADECAALIDRIETLGPEPAPVSTGRGTVMMPELRNNDRVMFDDPTLASLLLQRVQAQVPARLDSDWVLSGANERLRCYRYRPGQRFRPHFDGCFERSETERSFLTFLVYLNTCEAGGATRFNDLELDVQPSTGAALLFNHHLLHEGAPVLAGLKYVVRTDLLYRHAPDFSVNS